jgi:dephospho-CoA kinase
LSKRAKAIIGICGGIGSGKSTVARLLAEAGCAVIDSDALNREVLGDPAIASELRDWWGPRVIADDGSLDRREVAEVIFGDPDERKRLESLTHPLIAERRVAMIAAGLRDPAVRAIILDSPLLFESNLDRQCDSVVFVATNEDRRLMRLQQTRGWDESELRRRAQSQAAPAWKQSRSDFTIRNEGSFDELRTAVVETLTLILAEYSPTESDPQ